MTDFTITLSPHAKTILSPDIVVAQTDTVIFVGASEHTPQDVRLESSAHKWRFDVDAPEIDQKQWRLAVSAAKLVAPFGSTQWTIVVSGHQLVGKQRPTYREAADGNAWDGSSLIVGTLRARSRSQQRAANIMALPVMLTALASLILLATQYSNLSLGVRTTAGTAVCLALMLLVFRVLALKSVRFPLLLSSATQCALSLALVLATATQWRSVTSFIFDPMSVRGAFAQGSTQYWLVFELRRMEREFARFHHKLVPMKDLSPCETRPASAPNGRSALALTCEHRWTTFPPVILSAMGLRDRRSAQHPECVLLSPTSCGAPPMQELFHASGTALPLHPAELQEPQLLPNGVAVPQVEATVLLNEARLRRSPPLSDAATFTVRARESTALHALHYRSNELDIAWQIGATPRTATSLEFSVVVPRSSESSFWLADINGYRDIRIECNERDLTLDLFTPIETFRGYAQGAPRDAARAVPRNQYTPIALCRSEGLPTDVEIEIPMTGHALYAGRMQDWYSVEVPSFVAKIHLQGGNTLGMPPWPVGEASCEGMEDPHEILLIDLQPLLRGPGAEARRYAMQTLTYVGGHFRATTLVDHFRYATACIPANVRRSHLASGYTVNETIMVLRDRADNEWEVFLPEYGTIAQLRPTPTR